MTKRSSKTAKADIKIRLTEALRAKIEKTARDHGVSMNAEMIERLNSSFDPQHDPFGSADVRRIAILMASAFSHGVRMAGGQSWVSDPASYREGALAVMEALAIGMPSATADDMLLFVKSLDGRIRTRQINKAKGGDQ